MKKFLKYFVLSLVVLTVIMLPVQYMLNKVGDVRLFAGEENLMEQMDPIAVDPDSPFYEAFQSKDRVNVLLLGVNQGMTDTIMLGSYDMKHQHVDVISIPRDTYYERNGVKGASLKINSIYHSSKNGGAVGMATAVSKVLLGMPIHKYVVVDYDGVKNIMDAIGGVEMDIPFHMKYDDTTRGQELHVDIPKGPQTINSDNVVEFLRFRHTNPWYARKGYQSYPEGDIGRVKMQQEFIKEAFKKSLGLKLPFVAKSVLENVDSDLELGLATSIALKAGGLTSGAIETYPAPGEPETIDGLSFWLMDEDGVSEMLTQIYSIGDETDAAGADGTTHEGDVSGENGVTVGAGSTDGSGADAGKEPGFLTRLWTGIFGDKEETGQLTDAAATF